jgi:hypothetical protein
MPYAIYDPAQNKVLPTKLHDVHALALEEMRAVWHVDSEDYL